MTEKSVLTPATSYRACRTHGNEVRERKRVYRLARKQLVAKEIELRRHIDRVAQMRRSLPAGGAVTQNYECEGQNGSATFSQLFDNKDTLIVLQHDVRITAKEALLRCAPPYSPRGTALFGICVGG